MLDLIRRKQKTTLIKFVFWAIIATFVGTIFLVWGEGGTSRDRAQADNIAAKVNDAAISMDQFQSAYGNLYRMYQNVYREALTPAVEKQLNLRQQAFDALVDQSLLMQEAKRQNLDVSKQELIDAIAKIEAFQENGVFSRDRYVQALRAQRMTTEDFEALERQQLLVDKARKALQQTATVSDADIENEYKNRNEKVNLTLVRLSPADFAARVQLDAAQLQSYFAANKAKFQLPDAVALQYIIIDPKKQLDGVTVTADEVQKYYERHLDQYEIPEQAKAAHILIRLPQDAGEALRKEKRATAEKILARAKGGEDFASLARTLSEDPGSAPRGGDLGFFQRGTMVPAFEQAVFSLKAGEIGDLVETQFGYHIVRVEQHHDARVRPLSEVSDQVQAGARQEKGRQLAMEKALDLYNMNRKGGGLKAAAEAAKLEIRDTGFVARNEAIKELGNAKELLDTAFAMAAGELARPVNLNQGVILFALKDKRSARQGEFAEVRPQVEAAWRESKAKELARTEGERLLAAARRGEKFADLARKSGHSAEESGLFARTDSHFIPLVGNSEELTKAAFALSEGAPIAAKAFEVDGNFIAVALKERQNADPAKLTTAVRETLRGEILKRKEGETVETALKELRSKATISKSPALVAALEG